MGKHAKKKTPAADNTCSRPADDEKSDKPAAAHKLSPVTPAIDVVSIEGFDQDDDMSIAADDEEPACNVAEVCLCAKQTICRTALGTNIAM